jgi:hypothetical protein
MRLKIDKRKKYYLVLDCETATLPYASQFNAQDKKKIAIAKPLIYDLGWKVIDRKGKVYSRKNYLISEIFSVPHIFNTAYYASKRPIYLEKLRNNEIVLTSWEQAVSELEIDLEYTECVGAYNSMFDFKKAITFTEEYMTALYSDHYFEWENRQKAIIDNMLAEGRQAQNPQFDPMHFLFRQKVYDMFDLWGLSVNHLLDNDEFRQMCVANEWKTASGRFYSTTAETTYRFLTKSTEFVESHTAIDDVEIETEIFMEIARKTKFKFEMGIIYFPFRQLGNYPRE